MKQGRVPALFVTRRVTAPRMAAAAKTGGRRLALFLIAAFAVYIVLGMLYESFAHPLTILSALPSAAFGALSALWATATPFTLMTSIVCILVVGMAMRTNPSCHRSLSSAFFWKGSDILQGAATPPLDLRYGPIAAAGRRGS